MFTESPSVTESRSSCLPLQEADADVKESGIFSGAGHLQDGGLMSQSPSLPLSGGRGFYKRGTEQRDQGRGLKSSPHAQVSTVHSDKASDGPVCSILV